MDVETEPSQPLVGMVARPASFVFDSAEAGVASSLVNWDKLRPDVQSRALESGSNSLHVKSSVNLC